MLVTVWAFRLKASLCACGCGERISFAVCGTGWICFVIIVGLLLGLCGICDWGYLVGLRVCVLVVWFDCVLCACDFLLI